MLVICRRSGPWIAGIGAIANLLACDGRPAAEGAATRLLPYDSFGLSPPVTWEELVHAEPPLDTSRVVLSHDVFGRMWNTLRTVKPGGSLHRLDLKPATIKVRLVSPGQTSRFGPLDPLVHLLDYSQEGFHWVGRWIVVPVGSELLVKEEDWQQFRLGEGRMVLHEEGVEFLPGPVETPPGLCQAYAGRLKPSDLEAECGPEGRM
jgi:hypothetical protein